MITRWLCAFGFGLVLASCGGGGSDSSPATSSGGTPPATDNPPSSGGNPNPSPDPTEPPPSSGGSDSGDGGNGPAPSPTPQPTPTPDTPPPSSGGDDSGNGDSGGGDGGSSDNNVPATGPLTDIQFAAPDSIAADASGNIYVVDGEEGQNRIRRIAPNGQATTLLQLDRPLTTILSLEVTPAGDIYYILSERDAQYSSRTSDIWKIVNGAPAQRVASINGVSLAVDPSNGDIYVQDMGEMKRIRQNGNVETLFSLDGGLATALTLHEGALWFHFDVAALGRTSHIVRWTAEGGWVGGSGFQDESDGPLRGVDMVSTDSGVYIIKGLYSRPNQTTSRCRVELFSTNTEESTFVAGGESCGYQDGTGQAAILNGGGITQASDGNLYVTDRQHNVIRRITPSGQVSLFAGTPAQ